MNMKKTIAALAACAMAVSAMATTVSAEETEVKSVHYDLTIKSKVKTADLVFTAKSVTGTATAITLKLDASVIKAITPSVTVAVADKSTKTSYTFTFTADSSSADYDGTTTWNGTDTLTIDLTKAQATSIQQAFANANNELDITVTLKDAILQDGIDQGKMNIALGNVMKDVGTDATDATPDGTPDYTDLTQTKFLENPLINLKIAGITEAENIVNAKGTVKDNDVKQPMMTNANTASNKAGTADIFARLATKGTKSNDSEYVNAPAVINDMIANYDDVRFTFNTAADNVLTEKWCKDNSWASASLFPGYYVTGIPSAQSWMGDDTFKSFPQHLYNLFGDESTGYTYSDSYTFNNLFNAALVANNGYTMNQSSVKPFEYSKTSVSFSWGDLTNNAGQFVSPANAITKLQLATSSVWYWDSMDVVGLEVAADDASTDAGIEDDGADLDDGADADDDADIDADDDVDADDDADVDADDDADVDADDDADADVDADVDAADDTVAENPGTGNAPIALAVIPVALAAAAVVAKKRG